MKWALKIAAKVVLSRVPLSYKAFRRLGMFRHGHMNKPAYAAGVFFRHVGKVGGQGALVDKMCLELGPGDSLASAIMAHAVGAKGIYLVDVGNFAEPDVSIYEEIVRDLAERGFSVAELKGIANVSDLLARTNATYLTDGLASLRSIPTGSVDIIWSQAVLEHVRLRELPAVLSELFRVMSPSGTMSHRIDFKDHLGGSLNNLRFSGSVWESEFLARSGFYTNRVRKSEFLRLIEEAGFELKEVDAGLWDSLPLRRNRMAAAYRDLSDEDLLTKNVDVVARPKADR